MKLNSLGLLNQKFLNEYCSGIFSDELDKLGFKNQVSNNWKLNNAKLRVFGKVRTITLEEVETPDEKIKKGLTFLGNLVKGEILLVKGSSKFAYFGELMSRLSQEIGIEGAIIDGFTRDTFYTQKIDFPIFGKGYTPVDIKGRGRVDETDVPIVIDGIKISSGDYIFGDNDAIVLIPKSIISILIPKVNQAAQEEFEIKEKIAKGVSIKEILLKHKEF